MYLCIASEDFIAKITKQFNSLYPNYPTVCYYFSCYYIYFICWFLNYSCYFYIKLLALVYITVLFVFCYLHEFRPVDHVGMRLVILHCVIVFVLHYFKFHGSSLLISRYIIGIDISWFTFVSRNPLFHCVGRTFALALHRNRKLFIYLLHSWL